MSGRTGSGLRRSVCVLSATAARANVPPRVVEEAARATEARFRDASRRPAWRVEAYFWGVVRKRGLAGGAPRIGEALVLVSLADELRSSGRSPIEVHAELCRVYGHRAEGALLEAYRPSSGAGEAA